MGAASDDWGPSCSHYLVFSSTPVRCMQQWWPCVWRYASFARHACVGHRYPVLFLPYLLNVEVRFILIGVWMETFGRDDGCCAGVQLCVSELAPALELMQTAQRIV